MAHASPSSLGAVLSCVVLFSMLPIGTDAAHFNAKSGVRPWVDVYTPPDVKTITSTRGQQWELVFSDEFNVPDRDFRAGRDYLWTALDLPDGVNAALEYYSPNMTSTLNDTDGRGVFQIKVMEDEISFRVYNAYKRPPAFEDHKMYYRAGMVQTWNKFCFQGGRMEVMAQLPGAVSQQSGNPDLGDSKKRVSEIAYYPTWPGIWLLGNLGRALFTMSTNRMWPWSFNECDKDLAKSQRINACDNNPGYGLNSNQGRGAPEIDLLEGGGTDVSTSIQLAPGMPDKFRMIPPTNDTNPYCIYAKDCDTIGANFPGIPSAVYKKREYNSWYQGLRYAPNRACRPVSSQIQNANMVIKAQDKGFTTNTCKGVNDCPASRDGYSDLGKIDDTNRYWGVNDVGGCMPVINGYMGSYLCDPDNTYKKCAAPRKEGNEKTNIMEPFNYQMDAISANSGLPLEAYTGYVKYEVEWVMGEEGYVRWLVGGDSIFEIPAKTMTDPPQDDDNSNPKKVMIEEPMYIILNVALSTSWGAMPPNPGKPCRGDGSNTKINRICDDFPMYMKVDYIRIYQDVSEGSTMAIGCDPKTHPTKKWIEGHIEEYQDARNKVIEVVGGAPCFTDDDCTVEVVSAAAITTGECRQGKCICLSPSAWGGPRCTHALQDTATAKGYGPSLELALIVGGIAVLVSLYVVYKFLQAKHFARVEGVGFTKGITSTDSSIQEPESHELSQSHLSASERSKDEKYV